MISISAQRSTSREVTMTYKTCLSGELGYQSTDIYLIMVNLFAIYWYIDLALHWGLYILSCQTYFPLSFFSRSTVNTSRRCRQRPYPRRVSTGQRVGRCWTPNRRVYQLRAVNDSTRCTGANLAQKHRSTWECWPSAIRECLIRAISLRTQFVSRSFNRQRQNQVKAQLHDDYFSSSSSAIQVSFNVIRWPK